MKKERLLHLLCSLFIMIMVTGSFSFGQEQEVEKQYYHYDNSFNDYFSFPLRIDDSYSDLCFSDSYYDIGDTVIRQSFLDTSYYDEAHPYVLVETSYKIKDIIETYKQIYVMAEKSDKIIKIFSKEEFEVYHKLTYQDNTLIFNPGGIFKDVFENEGVVNSLDKVTSPEVVFYNDTITKYGDYNGTINLGPNTNLYFEYYNTKIGHILSGKYITRVDKIVAEHPEYIKAAEKADDRNLRLDYYKKINKLSNYFGEDYHISFNQKRSLLFESDEVFTFGSKFEFDKFLKDNNLESDRNYTSFTDSKFKIYKRIHVSYSGDFDETSSYVGYYNDTSVNPNYFNAVENLVNNLGVRISIDSRSNNYKFQRTVVVPFSPTYFASNPRNGLEHQSDWYQYKLGNSVFNVVTYPGKGKDKNIPRHFDELLGSNPDSFLKYLGLETKKRLAIQGENNKSPNFDLSSGLYFSDEEHFTLDYVSDDIIIHNNNEYYYPKSINRDPVNKRTVYTTHSGVIIESHPLGFILVDPATGKTPETYYKFHIKSPGKFISNPYTNNIMNLSNAENSYWNFKNYYKGEVSLITNVNGVEHTSTYNLDLENVTYTNINNYNKIIHYKGKNILDNSIKNIDVKIENDTVTVVNK